MSQDLETRMIHIGNICGQWASVEYVLSILIWQLLKVDSETGKILTGGLDMMPKLNMAITLGNHLRAPRALVQSVIVARSAIQCGIDVRRNQAVHGVSFLISESPFSVGVEVHRGKGRRQKEIVTNDQLHDLATELSQISCTLDEACKHYGVFEIEVSKPARLIAKNKSLKRSGKDDQPAS